MKKICFLFTTAFCFFILLGCSKEVADLEAAPNEPTASSPVVGVIVRASTIENATVSEITDGVEEPIVFTGNDIQWFSESTKEIRFKNNLSLKTALSTVQVIKFYVGGEFLFSSLVHVNSLSSQIINSLVLYYNIAENKYYLLDGYPPLLTSDKNGSRIENMKQIEDEWNKFINQLKNDSKYVR